MIKEILYGEDDLMSREELEAWNEQNKRDGETLDILDENSSKEDVGGWVGNGRDDGDGLG